MLLATFPNVHTNVFNSFATLSLRLSIFSNQFNFFLLLQFSYLSFVFFSVTALFLCQPLWPVPCCFTLSQCLHESIWIWVWLTIPGLALWNTCWKQIMEKKLSRAYHISLLSRETEDTFHRVNLLLFSQAYFYFGLCCFAPLRRFYCIIRW